MVTVIPDGEMSAIRCTECESMLAFTKEDITEICTKVDSDNLRVNCFIRCPKCAKNVMLGYKCYSGNWWENGSVRL